MSSVLSRSSILLFAMWALAMGIVVQTHLEANLQAGAAHQALAEVRVTGSDG